MYKNIINKSYPDYETEIFFHDKVNRAAQFAPFSALTGYESAIKETARYTDTRIEPDEYTINIINRHLTFIKDNLDDKFEVSITYFVPDKTKKGGSYVTQMGIVKKIDEYKKYIVMEDDNKIPIQEIILIESDLFDDLD